MSSDNKPGKRKKFECHSASQRGDSMLSLLASLALVVGAILWMASDYLPADAEELQAVVVLAERSVAAKTTLATSLKETPNPNRAELRRMRMRINDVVVTEIARATTGDPTLESRAELEAASEMRDARKLAEMQSKRWADLSAEERFAFAASKWPIALGLLGCCVVAGFGWRAMRASQ